MRKHYLELKIFLNNIEECPEIVTNCYYKVFSSEPRLYMDDSKFNHRIHGHMELIQDHLFQSLPEDKTALFSIITRGASFMQAKLCSYASDFLRNGIYWEPDAETTSVLKALEPSHDLCESILGLNDYLCTALPNMLQITKSNLTEIKKNHTMKWFHELPKERQKAIIDLAVNNRAEVRADYREHQNQLIKKRQDNLVARKRRADMLGQKAASEKEKLSKLHLVTSTPEFESSLNIIKEDGLSLKREEKRYWIS